MATKSTFPSVEQAFQQAMRRRVLSSIGCDGTSLPVDDYAALVAELLTWDALEGRAELTQDQRETAKVAFALLREFNLKGADRTTELAWQVRIGCLAVLADLQPEARKALASAVEPEPGSPGNWLEFTRISVWGAWLGLLRLGSTADVERAKRLLVNVRNRQKEFERPFFKSLEDAVAARGAALELMGLYFLGTAAERLAEYLVRGLADGAGDIESQLDMYFERVMSAWDQGMLPMNADVAFLLQPTAHALVKSSIRTATKSANSLTRRFAESLISRPANPLFQLLPPQRKALLDDGLASNVHRSVVVNFPTSSGKTLLAEFNILQSLNDLGAERGWVAYVAPTRALVNQVANRLRRDFAPLEKRVERLSPALEFDTVELSALAPRNLETDGPPVDVFVCTPEKLDLLIRREELCKHLGRLALVVVDEAHNLGAQDERSIKLELLLAVINREHPASRFLLLTPFINNAKRIAEWLDKGSNKDYSVEAHWVPNDRIVGIAAPPAREGATRGRKADHVFFKPALTSKATLHLDEQLRLDGVDPKLGLTVAAVNQSASKLSVAAVQVLSKRGPTVMLCRIVNETWSAAALLAKADWPSLPGQEDREAVARFVEYELGSTALLPQLLRKGVAVHHSGLPEEVAQAIEWLFEGRKLHVLCATTTLAQGVNFPIANLVISSIHPAAGYGQLMSYSDFWNIAGRVGRVDQDAVGVVALAASNQEAHSKCEDFLRRSTADLVSKLVAMVADLGGLAFDQGLSSLVHRKEWSAFSQFIAHTLRQVGVARFSDQVELVLRGSFGYQSLRDSNLPLARELLAKTRQYAQHIAKDMGSVALVDVTGFSFESVRGALGRLSQLDSLDDLLDPTALFSNRGPALRDVMGVLLHIPEIRDELEVTKGMDGSRIAEMLADWVHGHSLEALAKRYFASDSEDEDSLTRCVRGFKRLSMSSSWGLSSVLSMKFGDKLDELSPQARQEVINIPSMVLYGVRTSEQIALRTAGVPRNAAIALSKELKEPATPYVLRRLLESKGEELWRKSLGPQRGSDYFHVWKMLEGM